MKNKLFTFLTLLILTTSLFPQTFIMSPPKGYSPNKPDPVTKVFFNEADSIILSWNKQLNQSNVKLKIGLSPGNYNYASISASGKRLAFIPSNAPLNLSTGRYYCVLTNSNNNTLSGIRDEYLANPAGIDFSNEMQFVVQAPSAPYASEPRGTITNNTPVFNWTAISGVPAYWIIVSSTPFQVVTDSNNNVSVQGANVVWDYITTGNSATYGQISPYSPFTQSPLPLFSGVTYNYTILNLYDPTNVAFASTVFGGAVSFTLDNNSGVLPPNLILPANNATFSGSNTIRFQWDPVVGANTYTFHLFNRVTQFGGSNQEIDLPIFSTTTTNTMLDFPARANLLKGKYVWFVVPVNNSGTGTVSQSRVFNYITPTEKYKAQAFSSLDNSPLLNYEFKINSTTGGFSPTVPVFVSNSSTYTDSIPADNYQFTARKVGYYDSTFTYTLNSTGSITDIILRLRPYPVTVSGNVRNQSGVGIASAQVTLQNIQTSAVHTTSTLSNGVFSFAVPKGNYTLKASRPGYLTSQLITIAADSGQVNIPAIFLVYDNATVTGKILNDNNQTVQLATVTATRDNTIQTISSDNEGNFSFNLSSGTWIIETSKNGFVSPAPKSVSLIPGEVLSGQNLILTPRANTVTGFVYKLITNSQGQTVSVPSSGVTVTAVPSAGTSVSAVTNSSGQFTLSIRNGSWSINASQNGYASGNPVQVTVTIAQTLSGVNFNLTPNPSSISGIITDPNGNAISGAIVQVSGVGSTTTLPSGNYTLSLPAGSFTMTEQKSGYSSPQPYPVNLDPGQNLTGINFQLVPNAGIISGKVTNTGLPLINALITAVNGNLTQTAATDNQGEFSLSIQPGSWNITISKQGFVTSQTINVNVGPGQTSSNNNVILVENTGVISGIVKSGSNLINNAAVIITEIGNSSNSLSSFTGINGNFSVSVNAGKTYTIVVIKEGYSSQNQATNIITPGGSVNLNFNLSANPSAISGKVRNNLQLPLNQVQVYLLDSQSNTLLDSTLSDINGNYNFGVTAGSFKITASRPGHITDNVIIQVSVGQNLTNINFTLSENFALLLGQINDNNGTGISGVIISLTSSSGGATTTSTNSGSYTFAKLIGGTYTVSFTKPGYNDSTISNYSFTDGQSKTLNIVLKKLSGKISGKITSTNNTPVTLVTVSAKNQSNVVFSAVTDNNGNYEITALDAGSYSVTASKSGFFSSQSVPVILSLSNLTGTANVTDMNENQGKFSGFVKDNSNNPILDASINLSGPLGSASAYSNTQGAFNINYLTKGNYNLNVTKSGYSNYDTLINVTDSTYLSLKMNINNSTIKGTVKKQNGQPLPYIVTVNAVNSQKSIYTATTNLNGDYEFTNIAANTSYTIYTQIFKEGVTNDTVKNVNVPIGQLLVGPINLTVTVSNSNVKGNVGTSSALVKLTNLGTNEVTNVSSTSSGNYQFGFLPNGNYRIAPEKTGFSFNPASRDVNLSTGNDTVTIDFQSSSNVGDIKITAADNSNSPVSGVSAALINYSSGLFFAGTTNDSGYYQFAGIPSGTYSAKLSKSGYKVTPDSAAINLGNGQSLSQAFVLKKNNSSVSGIVSEYLNSSNNPSVEANVKVRNLTTGQSATVKTGSDGSYKVEELSAGDISVIAFKTGFVADTIKLTLADGEVKTGVNLNIKGSFVQITGKVVYKNSGVPNVSVTASSSSIVTVLTNSSGDFVFPNAQIKTSPSDTTLFEIKISGNDIPSQSKIISIAGSQVGGAVSVPNFVLPSGRISLKFSDGDDVNLTSFISGLKVVLFYPDGQQIEAVTNESGSFISSDRLSSGSYKLSLSKDELLMLADSSLSIKLDSDTALVNRTIYLPYKHTALTEILPARSNIVKVSFKVRPTNASGILYYKKVNSLSFTNVSLVLGDSSFTGTIPPLNTLEDVVYYIEINDAARNSVYRTDQVTVTPTAEGILSSILVSPDLGSSILRKGDEIDLSLNLKDGKNLPLTDFFTGTNPAGSVIWNLDDATAATIKFPVNNDSTSIKLQTNKEGSFKLNITASLNGVVINKKLDLLISNTVLKTVSVSTPVRSLNNKSLGIKFDYSAKDSSGRNIYLGNSITWSVEPLQAGTITKTGFFKPADSSYIGIASIFAHDALTNLKGVIELPIYALLSPSSNITLSDKLGMFITIRNGSVPSNLELGLAKPQFGPGKKTFAPIDQNTTYVVSDKQYQFYFKSDVGLPGDSLLKAADLEMPLDNSLKFFSGEKVIANYNYKESKWTFKSTEPGTANSFVTKSMYKQGQYAVLSLNEPLGIKYFALLPTPFSPEVSPLKIGYFLSTNSPPASVTIKIYNIRGEIVRTILENSLQDAGIYGGKKGKLQIEWDGKTDDGLTANNGRYIVRITAKDISGETSELKQVVLIK